MKTKFKNYFTLFVLCFSVGLGNAQDWPGWRGENRSGKVENFQEPEKWPDKLSQVWQRQVGLGDASMSMVNGKLFLHVEQDGQQYALCSDAKNGKELWKTALNKSIELSGGGASHPGPRATPEVAGDKIYTLGTGGELHCLDAASGKILWENVGYTEVPVFYTAMSPLVVDGMCVAHLNGRDNGAIVAFDAENGKVLWELKGEPCTYASPVLMSVGNEDFIVFQTETDLIGVSKKGKLLWEVATPGERRFYNSTTPIVDDENVIVCGQGIGTKSFNVKKENDAFIITENWHNPDLGGCYNTPVLKNGYLFGHEARLGKMYCLNAKTGETAWSDENANHRFVATLDLGKYILSLPATGKILITEPAPGQYVEKANYQVAESEVYAHPLVEGNRIYVKDKDMLTCWEIK